MATFTKTKGRNNPYGDINGFGDHQSAPINYRDWAVFHKTTFSSYSGTSAENQ